MIASDMEFPNGYWQKNRFEHSQQLRSQLAELWELFVQQLSSNQFTIPAEILEEPFAQYSTGPVVAPNRTFNSKEIEHLLGICNEALMILFENDIYTVDRLMDCFILVIRQDNRFSAEDKHVILSKLGIVYQYLNEGWQKGFHGTGGGMQGFQDFK